MDLGMPEILIIALIVLLLFGPGKLPGLGAGLGKGIRSFKQALAGDEPKADAAPADGGEQAKG